MATEGKFEIKLLNQICDSEHHSVTVTYDDNTDGPDNRVLEGDISEDGWGCPQFISMFFWPACAWFLKFDCVLTIALHVCVYACVSAPRL